MKRIGLLILFCVLPSWANPLSVGSAVQNFPLVNEQGKPFQLYDLKGKYVILSFVFTRCPLPKMCPLNIQLNQKLVRLWKNKKTKTPFQILLVTLDPDYDTPAVLKEYASARKLDLDHFTLATGRKEVLQDFAMIFGVVGMPMDGTIAHNMKTLVLDPEMRLVDEYSENKWKPEALLAKFAK